MTSPEDKQLTQTGIAASVVIHAVMFFIMAWLLGLDQAARELWHQAKAASEQPKVTLLFPEQIMPMPALKARRTEPKKEFVSTSANEAATEPPTKADFQSDRNTKAASKAAPFPDATQPLPSMSGRDQPSLELAERKANPGKIAADDGHKNQPTPVKPTIKPRTPEEPKALPEQIAKAQPTPMAKLMQEVEKSDARLSVDVRKPSESALPQVAAPVEPPVIPETKERKQQPDNFSPVTDTTKTKGAIANEGDNAVNAVATPQGRYIATATATIKGALAQNWRDFLVKHRASISPTSVKVMFYVNRHGKVEDVYVIDPSGNPLVDEFTTKTIREVRLNPINGEVANSLGDERLLGEYTFTIN